MAREINITRGKSSRGVRLVAAVAAAGLLLAGCTTTSGGTPEIAGASGMTTPVSHGDGGPSDPGPVATTASSAPPSTGTNSDDGSSSDHGDESAESSQPEIGISEPGWDSSAAAFYTAYCTDVAPVLEHGKAVMDDVNNAMSDHTTGTAALNSVAPKATAVGDAARKAASDLHSVALPASPPMATQAKTDLDAVDQFAKGAAAAGQELASADISTAMGGALDYGTSWGYLQVTASEPGGSDGYSVSQLPACRALG